MDSRLRGNDINGPSLTFCDFIKDKSSKKKGESPGEKQLSGEGHPFSLQLSFSFQL
jgi:hypothetical protein